MLFLEQTVNMHKSNMFFLGKRSAILAMYILAMLCTLVAFIFVTVYCITDKYFFPVTRSAILFFVSGKVLLTFWETILGRSTFKTLHVFKVNIKLQILN